MDAEVKQIVTRQDLADLLTSIGRPGENREEKLAAVGAFNKQNRQGHDILTTVESFSEW